MAQAPSRQEAGSILPGLMASHVLSLEAVLAKEAKKTEDAAARLSQIEKQSAETMARGGEGFHLQSREHSESEGATKMPQSKRC